MPTLSMRLGKTRGLRRMADDAGHFTMVALDQRPPIANLVAAKRGIAPSQVSFADMIAVKRLLVEALGQKASAMLLDPNYAVPAALDQLPARAGMLVTLEDHRFQDTAGGRLSHSIRDWSVEKIKRMGADGVKVLAWYRPDASPEVLAHQNTMSGRLVKNAGTTTWPMCWNCSLTRSSSRLATPHTTRKQPTNCRSASSTACASSLAQNMASTFSSWKVRSREQVCPKPMAVPTISKHSSFSMP